MNKEGRKRASARNVVVIAASVGGIQALGTLMENLPANLSAAVVIVQHISRSRPSHLANILARRTPMPVKQTVHGDVLCHACAFVAPPDQHVFIGPGGILQLSQTPPIHFTRPSAEPLFCSAAAMFGKRAIGVVLTGSDSDGSICVPIVKNAGGKIIVQNEETSMDFGMPHSAIQTGTVDLILPLSHIAGAIVECLECLKTRDGELPLTGKNKKPVRE